VPNQCMAVTHLVILVPLVGKTLRFFLKRSWELVTKRVVC